MSLFNTCVNQDFYASIQNYNNVRKAIDNLCWGGSGKIYGIHVKNKTNATIVCYTHLNIIALSEMKYNCTSCTEKELYFEATQKRFCPGFLRHLCEMYSLVFPFVDFTVNN